ncbi:class A beta-lactamase [Sphingosinicella sp. CPCC 101087]|uniref:class A beta-lactamase n=1 Tax=Sphingosinicella sp. CPCC 101087 TaxID=2497754 RepID=UPI001FB18769|nr:class A beta-lactamase [Sphingosinicella sp. CPCC 101087]
MASGEIFRRAAHILVLLPALALSGCIPQAQSAQAVGTGQARTQADAPKVRPARSAHLVQVQRRQPAAPTALEIGQRILDTRIRQLAQGFDGDVGIAVRDVESGWTTSWNGTRHFPQQSVSKFWVALTAFQRVDAGELDLSQRVTLRREDLTLFHQPIASQIGSNGYTTTLGDLLFRALTQSDNTANDAVLRRAGGPEAVRAMLARKGIQGVRFGPGERLMQSQIAGLQWQPSYSVGRAFYQARSNVPLERRRTAFESYVEDPIDGATPEGLVEGLARLQRGELLSRASTERMLSIMSQTRTGRQRLTGGLAPGWRIAHKTGTGQVLGSTQTGYNDIGILTSPEGRHYAVAVMIGRTSVPIPRRMELMQDVTRAVISFDRTREAGTAATR